MDLLAFTFGIVAWIYDLLFKLGLIKTRKVNCFVVSVGNLSVGGTGKTPSIEWLIDWSLKNKVKVGVVAKGYGAKLKGVHKVNLTSKIFFGDEPEAIAQKYPNVPVYVSSKKYLAAKVITEQEDLDLLLIDDGFQHKRLHRDLDLLLVDALSKEPEWALLPKGRLRESFKSALRADCLLLTRANLVDRANLAASTIKLLEAFKKQSKPIVNVDFEFIGFKSAKDSYPVTALNGEIVLVSGIGRPSSFEMMFKKDHKVVKHFIFADHHNYTAEEINRILSEYPNCNIVTTQKDFVKISKLKINLNKMYVAELKVSLDGDVNAVERLLLKGVNV